MVSGPLHLTREITAGLTASNAHKIWQQLGREDAIEAPPPVSRKAPHASSLGGDRPQRAQQAGNRGRSEPQASARLDRGARLRQVRARARQLRVCHIRIIQVVTNSSPSLARMSASPGCSGGTPGGPCRRQVTGAVNAMDMSNRSRARPGKYQTNYLRSAAIPDHYTPDFDIVIILAPPRSFTTVVSAMLGQHPQLYGLPETHFFTCDSIDEWATLYRKTDRMQGAWRAIAQIIFGEQTMPTVCMARLWLQERSYFTTAEVLRVLGQRVAPKILVEKTPKAAQRLQHMQRMMREFPRARFLHLLRHPYGQVNSLLERRLRFLGNGGSKSLLEAAQDLGDPARFWLTTHQAILHFLRDVPPEQQFCTRGEDLLSAPDEHLREIAHWLGIRSDDDAIEAMKHPERSAFARKGPPNASHGGDEKFFTDPVLRSYSTVTPPLDAQLPWCSGSEVFSEPIRQLARNFGYM